MRPQGLVVADVAEVQARQPNARIKLQGEPLYWDDTFSSHYTYPVAVRGKRYLFQSDASGRLALRTVDRRGRPAGCSSVHLRAAGAAARRLSRPSKRVVGASRAGATSICSSSEGTVPVAADRVARDPGSQALHGRRS